MKSHVIKKLSWMHTFSTWDFLFFKKDYIPSIGFDKMLSSDYYDEDVMGDKIPVIKKGTDAFVDWVSSDGTHVIISCPYYFPELDRSLRLLIPMSQEELNSVAEEFNRYQGHD